MQALPFVLGLITAALIAPRILRTLEADGFTRENFRGRRIAFPFGFTIVAAAVMALVPLALLDEVAGVDVYPDALEAVALYAFGMAFLGLVDDLLTGESRGWRGHGAALMRGGFPTGALKAVGALGLALLALSGQGLDDGAYIVGALLIVLCTNLFNLLDLRPGRSWKGFLALGAGVTLATLDVEPLAAVGLFAGAIVVVGLYDVRERAMLGDTGANLIGAVAGLWLVLALSLPAQLVALGVILAITVYGEFRSISAFIERTPGLRQLDALGRPAAPIHPSKPGSRQHA